MHVRYIIKHFSRYYFIGKNGAKESEDLNIKDFFYDCTGSMKTVFCAVFELSIVERSFGMSHLSRAFRIKRTRDAIVCSESRMM